MLSRAKIKGRNYMSINNCFPLMLVSFVCRLMCPSVTHSWLHWLCVVIVHACIENAIARSLLPGDGLMQNWNGPSDISSDGPQQLTTDCYPSCDVLLIRDESIMCGLAIHVATSINWRYTRHNAENRPEVLCIL